MAKHVLSLSDSGKDYHNRPEKVCLCGSTRFFKTFDDWNFRFTLEGKIVLSIGCNTKSDKGLSLTADDKVKLDELHKRKIDLADWVFVLDVDGYIGSSTRSEIEYAKAHGKLIRFLSLEYPDYKEPQDTYHNPADVAALSKACELLAEHCECPAVTFEDSQEEDYSACNCENRCGDDDLSECWRLFLTDKAGGGVR
jgi:hypothetical protein